MSSLDAAEARISHPGGVALGQVAASEDAQF